MKKLYRVHIILLVALMMLCGFAQADGIVPYADSEFDSASASLSTRKDVSFSCETYETKALIQVTGVWLQRKVDGKWKYERSLPAPSKKATNTISYAALMDYSDKIGSGTFRVGFIVDADGHSITRYSNERTF